MGNKQSAEPAVAALAAAVEHTRLKAKPKPKTVLRVWLRVRRLLGLNGLLCCMAGFPKPAIDD